ncbi:hypothetical protein AMAG_18964 [Allomyces macrogynus ATCC 38327]|uniref:Uncharacterized protein n=1 Tax=Allomyces macrogynus (strain ATCC 38327) TaxID=578462 RepID=A0A0L0SLD0_ALLM3|nr:hypothetical protein AMAG_18964 [Allomyces macrogynus ATCC 38327]|eukprot:KNE63194.1 hypothetical protein AMAG_18964 [Allomyces macrogynus ATCC 38327]
MAAPLDAEPPAPTDPVEHGAARADANAPPALPNRASTVISDDDGAVVPLDSPWAAIVRSLASKIASAVDLSPAIHVAGISAWRSATLPRGPDPAPSDRDRAIAGVLSSAFAELGKFLVAVQCAPAATRAAHARGIVQENVAGFFAVLTDTVVHDPAVRNAVRELADEYETNLAVKLLVAEPGDGRLKAPAALAVAGVFRAAASRWAGMKRDVPGLVLAVPRAGARWDPRWMVAVGGEKGGEVVVLATVPAAVLPEAGVVIGPARVWVAK